MTGHHGLSRMGRLILFDNSLGTHEADGVVQSIPGRGQKVEPIVVDRLYNNHWPQATSRWPLATCALGTGCWTLGAGHCSVVCWGLWAGDWGLGVGC